MHPSVMSISWSTSSESRAIAPSSDTTTSTAQGEPSPTGATIARLGLSSNVNTADMAASPDHARDQASPSW
jgi:hypothetical protein